MRIAKKENRPVGWYREWSSTPGASMECSVVGKFQKMVSKFIISWALTLVSHWKGVIWIPGYHGISTHVKWRERVSGVSLVAFFSVVFILDEALFSVTFGLSVGEVMLGLSVDMFLSVLFDVGVLSRKLVCPENCR